MEYIRITRAELRKKKVHKIRIQGFFMLLFFSILVLGCLFYLLLIYRPFTKWVKLKFSLEDGSYKYLDNGNMFSTGDSLYTYTIDGVQYKTIVKNVVLDNPQGDAPYTMLTLYVNKNNPSDVKRGADGGSFIFWIFLMLIVVGLYVSFLVIRVLINPNKMIDNQEKGEGPLRYKGSLVCDYDAEDSYGKKVKN